MDIVLQQGIIYGWTYLIIKYAQLIVAQLGILLPHVSSFGWEQYIQCPPVLQQKEGHAFCKLDWKGNNRHVENMHQFVVLNLIFEQKNLVLEMLFCLVVEGDHVLHLGHVTPDG